ncbi:MAG: zinc ribbon domain-containing protein [Cyanobacteria bacterium J06614_10]
MTTCPKCDRTIPATALTCPHCKTTLKAHGHPGMPLYRAADDSYLCPTCAYHQDNSCTFPKRPTATTCTLYQPIGTPAVELTPQEIYPIPFWRKVNKTWLIAGVILAICILINFL